MDKQADFEHVCGKVSGWYQESVNYVTLLEITRIYKRLLEVGV